jgi:hypothetical protein
MTRFIEQTSVVLAAIHEEVAEIRASNAQTDRQLLQMQQQADKDRQQVDRDRKEFNERFEKEHKEFNERFEKERKEFNERYAKDTERYEKERKDFNKRMAEISESMGTLIEDMVAPCGFQLARAIFATEDAETCAIRIKRRHPQARGEMMEIDLLAIGPTKILVVEVKRRADAAKIAEYREKLARLPEFFPELASKTLLAAVASVYLDPSVVAHLNRQKLYGIALGDEVMEVVNLAQF